MLQAKSQRELTEAVADFMDCSIVIPPTEIHNEAMLAPIIGFQKKLLRDRIQSSNPVAPLESKTRRGGRPNHGPKNLCGLCGFQYVSLVLDLNLKFFLQCPLRAALHLKTPCAVPVDLLAACSEISRGATSTTRVTSLMPSMPKFLLRSSSSTLPPCLLPSRLEGC